MKWASGNPSEVGRIVASGPLLIAIVVRLNAGNVPGCGSTDGVRSHNRIWRYLIAAPPWEATTGVSTNLVPSAQPKLDLSGRFK